MPPHLVMPGNIFRELLAEATLRAPDEACGLLAGRDGRVERFYPIPNADASPEHFSMHPRDQFAAVKDMRARGLEMLGIWHSHPATPARMSAEDLRLALTPDTVHVILTLAGGGAPLIQGFVVRDGKPELVPITIAETEVAKP